MTSVAVSGAGGRLASAVTDAVVAADDLDLVALFNPNRVGEQLHGLTVVGLHGEIAADVVVETAHPDVVFDNLAAWKKAGMAAVVGTSGFTPERLDTLRALWGLDGPPCLVVPNFSIGAVLMMRFAAEAAGFFESTEIIERHHSDKPDAPSGTALATAMGSAAAGGSSSDLSEELVTGSRGGLVEGIRVHSLRLPGLISQQEVALSNVGEILSIEHLSTSYESFGSGAALAARRVGDLEPGVHLGLDIVL
jgi:4-hydroxy-tetrahydrodipicolinate reductase